MDYSWIVFWYLWIMHEASIDLLSFLLMFVLGVCVCDVMIPTPPPSRPPYHTHDVIEKNAFQ